MYWWWALGISMACIYDIWFYEWVVKFLKKSHLEKTLYFTSISINFPKDNNFQCKIQILKNLRVDINVHLRDTNNVFSAPMILNKIIIYIMNVNKLLIPQEVDLVILFNKKTCLFNLNPQFTNINIFLKQFL